jgi:hypothetical protein
MHGILHPSNLANRIARGRAAAGARRPCADGSLYTLRGMARLTQHGLRRVLGTSALFSTACLVGRRC